VAISNLACTNHGFEMANFHSNCKASDLIFPLESIIAGTLKGSAGSEPEKSTSILSPFKSSLRSKALVNVLPGSKLGFKIPSRTSMFSTSCLRSRFERSRNRGAPGNFALGTTSINPFNTAILNCRSGYPPIY